MVTGLSLQDRDMRLVSGQVSLGTPVSVYSEMTETQHPGAVRAVFDTLHEINVRADVLWIEHSVLNHTFHFAYQVVGERGDILFSCRQCFVLAEGCAIDFC